MHDIDSTMTEFEEENFDTGEFEQESDFGAEAESPFNDAEEMELASELLTVTDDAELDQFLGKLFKNVGRKVGRFMKSPVGRMVGGMIKNVAKKALPIAGGAIGSFIAPGVGTALGSQAGAMAGKMLGLELEGLSPEDQEFEVARRVVRLAGTAAKKATLVPANGSPAAAAKAAVTEAAKRHAPGLVGGPGVVASTGARSGRWIRRGGKIILFGV